MNDTPMHTRTVYSSQRLTLLCSWLIGCSCLFMVQPRPDDYWEVSVRANENEGLLDEGIKTVNAGTSLPEPPAPEEETEAAEEWPRPFHRNY